MGLEEFKSLSYDQFNAIYEQWQTRQESLDRERWVQARWLMWASLRAHSKRLKPTDLMRFEWEQKKPGIAAPAEKSTLGRFEQMAALWNDEKHE